MKLLHKGDTFVRRSKRTFIILLEDIEINVPSLPESLVRFYSLIWDMMAFYGSIPRDSLYYKISKPSFKQFSWERNSMRLGYAMEMLRARHPMDALPQDNKLVLEYLGRIKDVELTTIRAMVDPDRADMQLTPMGNEILWQSILELGENPQEFESF